MGIASSRFRPQTVRRILPSAVDETRTSQLRYPLNNTIVHSNKIIEQDIKFINNLKRLGPVLVEHNGSLASSSAKISSGSNSHSRAMAINGLTPTISVQTLHDFLDKRNNLSSSSEVAAFAENHGLSQIDFDQLVEVVNSPSFRIASGSTMGKEFLRQIAFWSKPDEP